MAISFSRPDPSSPSAVGAASFPVARRGYDQNEVRDFLRMVAAEMARLQERERFLEAELKSMQTRGLSGPGRLDEETVTTLLGEEAARVLTTARDAATQIRERAEESATRLVKDAAEDATRIREAAVEESQRIHQDATADANAEVEMAKQQGRDMVNEAREYREKVLTELSRRRDAARNQIEQLLHGRDRLLNAFERARIASESVLNELHEAHDEPETLVNLAPTTGPIPVVNPYHPSVAAYDQAAEEVAAVAAEVQEIVQTTPAVIDIPLEEILQPEQEITVDAQVEETVSVIDFDIDAPIEIVEDAAVETADPVVSEPVAEVVVDEAAAEAPVSNVVSLFDRRPTPVPEVAPEVDHPVNEVPADAVEEVIVGTPAESVVVEAPAAADHSVDDIFARLRAGSVQDVAAEVSAEAPAPVNADKPAEKKPKVEKKAEAPEPVATVADPARFAARSEVISPLVTQVARKLKRVLADEQNNVLQHLKGKRASLELDAILGTVEEQAARYASAVAEEAMAAASAGVKSMKDAKSSPRRVTQKAVDAATVAVVAEGLVAAFREDARIAVGEAEGDREILAGLLRDTYRTWKMSGIDAHVDDVMCATYNAGAFLSADPSASLVWMVDPDNECCGDCNDNALAGAVTKGQEFPTGHTRPMAHNGCRCLIGPAAH